MREGWYLMSTRELERALASHRAGDEEEFGIRLSVEEALRLRNAGNVPDADDRSLRLVLFVDDVPLDRKRASFEPDYHRAPEWRRPGSRPVNVVPLRTGSSPETDPRPWWETPRVKELEEEWRASGSIAGIAVPAGYRSFVFKTVIALQDAGQPITADSIADSVARWLTPEDARRIRDALTEEGPGV